MVTTKQQWDDAHASHGSSHRGYSRLYTDENPATTIKGLGFKDRQMALRTIDLTSQRGVRYKQYWTIRAMRERAIGHPHFTEDMKEAVTVMDEWLEAYKEPGEQERREQQKEWEAFHKLCSSSANGHSYGENPSKEELRRARNDLVEGQKLLVDLIQGRGKYTEDKPAFHFTLTSFVAIFGGPGLHGYGKHTIDSGGTTSQICISSVKGIVELIGESKTAKLALIDPIQMHLLYDRQSELAGISMQSPMPTLTSLWSNSNSATSNNEQHLTKQKKRRRPDSPESDHVTDEGTNWTCTVCTFIHDRSNRCFLSCAMCGSERLSNDTGTI